MKVIDAESLIIIFGGTICIIAVSPLQVDLPSMKLGHIPMFSLYSRFSYLFSDLDAAYTISSLGVDFSVGNYYLISFHT